MRRLAVLAAASGVLALEVGVALAYLGLGTWWHWLLHQLVGWGVGLAVAALVGALTRYRVPAVVALLGGQLLSIVPDLQFRYLRHPHSAVMDLWLGHISIHTGPSPVLVSWGVVLLGGWAFLAQAYAWRRAAAVLAAASLALLAVACLLARDVPTRLQDYPLDTSPVVTDGA